MRTVKRRIGGMKVRMVRKKKGGSFRRTGRNINGRVGIRKMIGNNLIC